MLHPPVLKFRIADTSMRPSLQPGDRILVTPWLRPRPGDLVVVRDPDHRSVLLVKRATQIGPSGAVVVLGDNPNVSRDSRHFGPVPRELVVGRAFYRYMPAHRRGAL